MRIVLVFLLLVPCLALAQAPPPEFQQTVAVTDANTNVTLTGAPMARVCLLNDGANAVAYDWSGVAVYSATAKAPITSGESRCFSQEGKSNKFRQVGLICDTGLTTSVRIIAMP